MLPPVLISVAHSRQFPGVTNGALLEHDVSRTASAAAVDFLTANGVPVVITECAQLSDIDYSIIKPALANSFSFALAVEIHCNGAGDPKPNYGEAIYYPKSVDGQAAGQAICDALKTAWPSNWPITGARANDPAIDLHYDFFLSKLKPPAVIVEGLFMSNPDQAQWLSVDGNPAVYGNAVAQGILAWWKKRYPAT